MKTFADDEPLKVDTAALTMAVAEFGPRIKDLCTPAVAITSPEVCEQRTLLVRTKKHMVKQVESHYLPLKNQAHRLHKTICEQESEVLTPLKASITSDEKAIGAWLHAEAQKRLAEQKRLQAEAEAAQQKEVEREAKKLERKGLTEEAAELREVAEYQKPIVTVAPVATPAGVRPPKPEWDFVIESPEIVPREFCMPDEGKIKAYIKAVGPSAKIAGVRVVAKDPRASVR